MLSRPLVSKLWRPLVRNITPVTSVITPDDGGTVWKSVQNAKIYNEPTFGDFIMPDDSNTLAVAHTNVLPLGKRYFEAIITVPDHSSRLSGAGLASNGHYLFPAIDSSVSPANLNMYRQGDVGSLGNVPDGTDVFVRIGIAFSTGDSAVFVRALEGTSGETDWRGEDLESTSNPTTLTNPAAILVNGNSQWTATAVIFPAAGGLVKIISNPALYSAAAPSGYAAGLPPYDG